MTTITVCLQQTDKLYDRISGIIGALDPDGDPRSQLAGALGAVTLEHGYSIRALLEVGHVTSAIVLLRTQFEAVVRSIWIHFAASDAWVEKVAALVEHGSLKEPSSPVMDEMLVAIGATAPPQVGRMLRQLKDGAWKPLNSYVHGGIHPVIQHHRGYLPEYAIQTLRNANGLSAMAAMLFAVMADDPEASAAIRQAQLDHLDCLPPLVQAE